MRTVTGQELDVVYEDFRAGEVVRTWCEIDKARDGLGFAPETPLEDGLRHTWEWFSADASRRPCRLTTAPVAVRRSSSAGCTGRARR